MTDPQHKFTVAICGGGIGGLCLAVALSRYPDIDVHVYEAAETFKEIGAGVMVWGRSWHVLRLLGLEGTLFELVREQAEGGKAPEFGFDFRKSDQPEPGFSFLPLCRPWDSYLFHRAQFIDVFVDRLPHHAPHLGKRLHTYTQSDPAGPITLQFSDGSTAVCDALIGCDGIKSTVRRRMYERKAQAVGGSSEMQKYVEPRWSGWVAYRALVPAEKLTAAYCGERHAVLQRPMMYCGFRKHIVSYAISQGKFANVVAFYSVPVAEDETYDGPWVSEVSPEEVAGCFAGWEPEAELVVKCIDKASKWVLFDLHPLPTYVDGCVALMGDAAHAMTPHQGAGAGQAIEDAFVLAEILGHPSTTRNSLSRALQAYDSVRRPLGNHVLEGSHISGKMYEFWHDQRNDYDALRSAISRQWDWVEGASPEELAAASIRWIRDEGERNAAPKARC